MPSGIMLNGVDLDNLFVAYVGGHTNAAATGININGVDLNQRYDNLIYGSSLPYNTFIQSNGADLITFFGAYGSEWTAKLPSFSTFTSSPQPASGTLPMTVTVTGGPGGSYTYTWSSGIKPSRTGASFNIVSGAGTATIQWYATAIYGKWCTINISCQVASVGIPTITATTSMTFHYGTPS